MKKILLIIGLMSMILACEGNKEELEGIIEKDKMVAILIEIHIAEGRVNEVKLPLDSALTYYKYLEGNIYKKYNIDSASFNKSMHHYSENIRELDDIYEVVLDSLNLRTARLEDVQNEEKED